MPDAKSILLIEDHDIVRRYYADHLRLVFPHYTIYEAATGKTGLDLYQWQTIDCVILDLSLPDMSGFQVLAGLVPVAAHPPVPVVILTSINSQSILDLAKHKGAFLALLKDLTSGDELAKVIFKAMAAIPVNGEKVTAVPPTPSVPV
jgi:DNA-binding NarL/FixJ family response regulator